MENNYNKYANAKEEVKESVMEEVNENLQVEDEKVKEQVEQSTTNGSKIGIVNADCSALNVREKPSLDARIICLIGADSELEIIDSSIDGWFKVCTETGAEGFCMKDFITVE